uniref:Uncharacterized protein n=1 Tax=Schistosoma haematobium TaxID=6185 RepID=A0A094ZY86_SCHHA
MLIINSNLAVDNRMVDISDAQQIRNSSNLYIVKLKVFIECRRDCSTKCNHSLFVYLANENECYTCLIECMSAFTQQAEKVGIQLKDIKKSNDANLLSDSLYAPGKKFPSYKRISRLFRQHQCNSLCMWGIFFFMARV